MVFVITQNLFNAIREIFDFTSSNTKIEKIFDKKLIKKKSKKNNEKIFEKKSTKKTFWVKKNSSQLFDVFSDH